MKKGRIVDRVLGPPASSIRRKTVSLVVAVSAAVVIGLSLPNASPGFDVRERLLSDLDKLRLPDPVPPARERNKWRSDASRLEDTALNVGINPSVLAGFDPGNTTPPHLPARPQGSH
jgi:hypothetical protein